MTTDSGLIDEPRHAIGERWFQNSTGYVYVVTRVGKRKLTMTCRRPAFDITVTAWVARLDDDPDWRRVFWCPECGASGVHRGFCSMFPGEPVVHGNRTPPPDPSGLARAVRFSIDSTGSFG